MTGTLHQAMPNHRNGTSALARQGEVRANQERRLMEAIRQFREEPSLRDKDIETLLTRPSYTKNVNWRAELIFCLRTQNELPLARICSLLGVSSSIIQKVRRTDLELDQLIQDYMAAFFENQAMSGDGNVHPAITIFGLKAKAGWVDAKDRAITQEQLAQFVEHVITVINEEVKDPHTSQRIAARLRGEPIPA